MADHAMEVARKVRREKSGPHVGPINSAVPGRTDRHEMEVPNGAYVIPSETVSHLGQNNTAAGMEVLKEMFPNSAQSIEGGPSTPVVTAGGEFVVSPKDVEAIGGGDLAKGHQILDEFVLSQRKKHIATLRKLAPPAKK